MAKRKQKRKRKVHKTIAFIGPAGNFTEQAAIQFGRRFPGGSKRIPQMTIMDVFRSVHRGRCEFGVVAVENMIGGIVRETLESIYALNVKVVAEIVIPIHHSLSVYGIRRPIREIRGHPQALYQCRKYLQKHFPRATVRESVSGSSHMQEIGEGRLTGVAAVGSELAAKLYGLRVIKRKIEDFHQNQTRFWMIAKKLTVKPSHRKISLAYHFGKDQSGNLHESLGYFARENVSLLHLSVLPSAKKMGDYVFHVDLEGNLNEERVQFALKGVRRVTDVLKIVGSYESVVR